MVCTWVVLGLSRDPFTCQHELDPFLIRSKIWAYPWLLKTPLKALPTLTRSSLWYLIGWSAYSDIRSSWFYVMTSLYFLFQCDRDGTMTTYDSKWLYATGFSELKCLSITYSNFRWQVSLVIIDMTDNIGFGKKRRQFGDTEAPIRNQKSKKSQPDRPGRWHWALKVLALLRHRWLIADSWEFSSHFSSVLSGVLPSNVPLTVTIIYKLAR